MSTSNLDSDDDLPHRTFLHLSGIQYTPLPTLPLKLKDVRSARGTQNRTPDVLCEEWNAIPMVSKLLLAILAVLLGEPEDEAVKARVILESVYGGKKSVFKAVSLIIRLDNINWAECSRGETIHGHGKAYSIPMSVISTHTISASLTKYSCDGVLQHHTVL